MSEEKTKFEDIRNTSEQNIQTRINLKKEKEIIEDLIFSNMIQFINKKEKFILGPEKTKIANFISQNYFEVYLFLDSLLKNNNLEGID